MMRNAPGIVNNIFTYSKADFSKWLNNENKYCTGVTYRLKQRTEYLTLPRIQN